MISSGKDMSCKELVELVTEYLEGTLPAHDVARFDTHIERCEGCADYLDQMRTTISLSGRLGAGSLPPEVRSAFLETFRDWRSGQTV